MLSSFYFPPARISRTTAITVNLDLLENISESIFLENFKTSILYFRALYN